MRLKVSVASANERLLVLVTQGLKLHTKMWSDYAEKSAEGRLDEAALQEQHRKEIDTWTAQVVEALREIFPMEREEILFHHPDRPMRAVAEPHYGWKCTALWVMDLVKGLDNIRQTAIPEYTDLPIQDQLYINDIDSFAKARDVNHAMYAHLLNKSGYLNLLENEVQVGLEEIIGERFHKEDHGGEINDLFTTRLVVNGERRATAFMLKGRGLKKNVMELGDCGDNGDQVLRLFDSPAELFVIQFVGTVAENVRRDAESKVALRRAQGKRAWYMIMDGEDTAQVLYAYGKIK
jgi:hypothetical protein